jgi:hypothetical protein
MASDPGTRQLKRVAISVDGKPVPLNPFVQKLVGNLVHGLVASLKMQEERYRSVEIQVIVEEVGEPVENA